MSMEPCEFGGGGRLSEVRHRVPRGCRSVIVAAQTALALLSSSLGRVGQRTATDHAVPGSCPPTIERLMVCGMPDAVIGGVVTVSPPPRERRPAGSRPHGLTGDGADAGAASPVHVGIRKVVLYRE